MEKYILSAAICALLVFSNYTLVVGLDAARGELQDARQTIEYIKPISTEISNDLFMINESIGRAIGLLEAAKSRDDLPIGLALLVLIGFGIQEWRHYRLKKAYEEHIQKKP